MKRDLVEREWTPVGPGPRPPEPRGRSLTVNLAESPLTWLHARGHLSDRELAAGECLRRDYEAAQLAPAVTMRWDPVRVAGTAAAGAGLHASERQLVARDRFERAVAAAGTGLADVLWRVVCAGESLADAERGLGWPSRSGKLVLRFALERVAGFYRLP
ncbi:DUF6456 domain-containing protein [Novosphingobium piscinae]|uniref:DUF6456 domain-containing protein n=1 Tax=Novosphingobium piscinae TaxID=1507448 RepID=A0A7X1FYF5_9SPHN|nr:DUF6456 domain-containing protein [Novosphingobium piscinae]MBC2668612.1 hypothetical protein [Novosphingobium piscinae]